MNVWRQRFPTVQTQFIIVYDGKALIISDHEPSLRRYFHANNKIGMKMVDLKKGKVVMETHELVKVLQSGEYDGERLFEDDDPEPTPEEIRAILTPQVVASPIIDLDPSQYREVFEDEPEVFEVKPSFPPDPPVVSQIVVPQKLLTGKRGRPQEYDLGSLALNDKLSYKGKLNAARVLASISSNKKFDGARRFKATQVGEQVWITRTI